VHALPDDWPFSPYEKIAESVGAWLGDDEAAYRALRGAEWVVTEKIHGANLCLVTDGVTIRAAKRKAFISDDDDFLGHRSVVERLAPALRRLAELASRHAPALRALSPAEALDLRRCAEGEARALVELYSVCLRPDPPGARLREALVRASPPESVLASPYARRPHPRSDRTLGPPCRRFARARTGPG
jgi:hypothetical protein